jgi:tRNA(Ile)-lysidine synthase
VIVEFQQYIDQQKLCISDNRILVAVSGGIDSVVMLDLFVKANYQISIAHCNFQLRDAESDNDEEFDKDLGKKNGLKVFCKKFDTRNYAEKGKLSIQVAARELRYAWFDELVEKEGFDYVAVAQHADDQLETFFINLLRGSGLAGLRGMPVKRDSIIRPLLFAKRKDIEQYAEKSNLTFREDSSNKEDTYLRNKIRLNLLTKLEKIDKRASDSTLESMHHLNEADILLQQLIDEKLKFVFREENGIFSILIDDLKLLEPDDIWMYYLLRNFNFNRDVTDNMVRAITEKQSGKVFYSASHKAIIDRDAIFIEVLKVRDNNEVYFVGNDLEIIEKPIALSFQTIHNHRSFKIKPDVKMAWMDKDKLSFPLEIRNWKKGDRFQPFGMKGSKLLSDYFIDEKMNQLEKQNIWLLISGKDIAWVIGHRISEKFKITKQTTRVLSITWNSN